MARLILPGSAALRNPNTVVAIGDSRVDQIHADSTHLNKSGVNHFNIGNALAGNRAVLVSNLGKSGDRTDQAIVRLPQALASGAQWLYILCGTNDIAQNYPTASTSGITAWTNVKAMIDAAVNIGMKVILVLDPGANNFTTAQIIQLAIFNENAIEYAERCGGLHLFDLRAALWNQQATSSTAITFLATLDGTHENLPAAYLAGKQFSTLLQAIMPPRPHGVHAAHQDSSVNPTMHLVTNPMFTSQSGGTLGGGMAGTVAGGWTVSHGGTAVVTASVGAAGDGSGYNEQVMATTFSAALDEGRLQQDVAIGNWNPGDILQASCEVVVDSGSSNLAGVCLYLQANGSGNGFSSVTSMDGYCMTSGWGAVTTEGYKMYLQTEKLVVPNYTTKSWVTTHLKVVGAGSGSATARVRRFNVRKRYA